MPYSTGFMKDAVKQHFLKNVSTTLNILDAGAGCGTYSHLLKAEFPNMDGIEIFPAYIDMFDLKSKYNNLFLQNVLDFDQTQIESSNEWLTCMKVLQKSRQLATGHVEASIRIWDLTNGQFLYFLEHVFNGFASTCAFMDQFSNGLLMSAHLDFDNSLHVWDLTDLKSGRPSARLGPMSCSKRSV